MMHLVASVALLSTVSADVYLQSPCGSNNRLDDENRDRNNDNRLFDSQNNNRGGCNVGNLALIAGSKLKLEWSAQHGSNNENVGHTQIILQYMCSDGLRDGTTTTTIPNNPQECYNNDCDNDVRFGRHENFDYYMNCAMRERNKGLFTASQQLNGGAAKFTRQNPNGARNAYECPEERDYYPYWQPTPWIDVAVLVDDSSLCAMYQQESQNVKSRFHCKISGYDLMLQNTKAGTNYYIPINNQTVCEGISFPQATATGMITTVTGQWREDPPWSDATGAKLPQNWAPIGQPDCKTLAWVRENHHGKPAGSGFFASYEWTVPNTPHEQCALRIRYNMSSNDYPLNLNATYNKPGTSTYPLQTDYGLNKTSCGYYLKNNPQVRPFCDVSVTTETTLETKLEFQLAINTAQIGRTFEDRSHRFQILPPSAGKVEQCDTITNLLVSGKRGNIVQVYPATEYRFVPDTLNLGTNDCVHPMWVGSNTNPNNNAGQGRQGSDRSNIVGMTNRHLWARQEGPKLDMSVLPDAAERGRWSESYPASIKSVPFLGWDEDTTNKLALNSASGEMSELDDSAPDFRLPFPRKCNLPVGTTTNYLCTRNNNFSNRSQKGRINCMSEVPQGGQVVGITVFQTSSGFRLVGNSASAQGETLQYMVGDAKDLKASSAGVLIIMVKPSSLTTTIPIVDTPNGIESPHVYFQASAGGDWTKVDAECTKTECVVSNMQVGSYIIQNDLMGGYIFLIVVAVLGVVGGLLFFLWKKNKSNG